jgi:hypothetical protein
MPCPGNKLIDDHARQPWHRSWASDNSTRPPSDRTCRLIGRCYDKFLAARSSPNGVRAPLDNVLDAGHATWASDSLSALGYVVQSTTILGVYGPIPMAAEPH